VVSLGSVVDDPHVQEQAMLRSRLKKRKWFSMSVRSLSLVSWLLDRVLAFVFAYIMLKGVRKITRHQNSDPLAVNAGTQSAK